MTNPYTLSQIKCPKCGHSAEKHRDPAKNYFHGCTIGYRAEAPLCGCSKTKGSILLHHLNAAREDLQKICELQGMVKNVKHNSTAICGNLRIETITILEKYYIPEAPDA